jgi:hypothetical protein
MMLVSSIVAFPFSFFLFNFQNGKKQDYLIEYESNGRCPSFIAVNGNQD